MAPTTLADLAKPCVYLICYRHAPLPLGQHRAWHYLGVSAYLVQDLRQLDTSRMAAAGRRAVLQAIEMGAGLDLVDVWPADSLASAVALRQRIVNGGGGVRACSICNPGNGRGNGRGVNRYSIARELHARGLPHAGIGPSEKQRMPRAQLKALRDAWLQTQAATVAAIPGGEN